MLPKLGASVSRPPRTILVGSGPRLPRSMSSKGEPKSPLRQCRAVALRAEAVVVSGAKARTPVLGAAVEPLIDGASGRAKSPRSRGSAITRNVSHVALSRHGLDARER